MTKYTADDFANARFAEHPDGGLATRSGEGYYTWEVGGVPLATDKIMAHKGWAPVPTKPQITESRLRELTEIDRTRGLSVRGVLQAYGVEVIPDPEPTNTELIADALIDGFEKDEFTLTSPFNDIAASLATRGITAPNVKGN